MPGYLFARHERGAAFLFIGSKLFNTLFTSLLPLALTERKFKQIDALLLAQDYSSFYTALLCPLYNIAVHWLLPNRFSQISLVFHAAIAGITFFSCIFVGVFPHDGFDGVLLVLLVAGQMGSFILSHLLQSWAVSSSSLLSRYRLLMSLPTSVLALLTIFYPRFFASNVFLAAYGLVCLTLCVAGILNLRIGGAHGNKETQAGAGSEESVQARSISFAYTVQFLIICMIGLNGEQILDASLKLKLKSSHISGDHWPIAIHYGITALAKLLAFGTSGSYKSPLVLVLMWGVAQLFRLAVMGANADVSSLVVTTGLIMLDKWSGSIGEVALETAILSLFSTAAVGPVSTILLMSFYQPIEDITGSWIKVIVREAKHADPGSSLSVLSENKGLLIIVLVLAICSLVTLVVARAEREKKKAFKSA